jgi:hypothetical protein
MDPSGNPMNGSDTFSEVVVINGVVYNRTWNTIGSNNEGDEWRWDEPNDEAIGTVDPNGNWNLGTGSDTLGMPGGPLLASSCDLILAQVLGAMANKKKIERINVGPYTIITDGQKVNIQIKVQYAGDGVTDDVVKKFNDGIEKWWSGSVGKYTVQTSVVMVNAGDRLRIDVPSETGMATMAINGRTGEWPSESSGWTAAHEIGHAFGLGDQYDLATREPVAGSENNIMGAKDKPPSEEDISRIVEMARALARKRGGG